MDKNKFKLDLEQLLENLRDDCAEQSKKTDSKGFYIKTVTYRKIKRIDIKKAVEQFTLEQFPNE